MGRCYKIDCAGVGYPNTAKNRARSGDSMTEKGRARKKARGIEKGVQYNEDIKLNLMAR